MTTIKPTRRGADMSLKRLLIAMAMAVFLATAVAACGGGDDDDADTTAAADTATTEEGGGGDKGPVTIVASVPPTDHGWLGAISKDAQAQADDYDDVDFQLLEAADSDSQAQQIEQVIPEKPDEIGRA